MIRDFALAPASVGDSPAGGALLRGHADLGVIGDKAYIGAPLSSELHAEHDVALLTVLRRDQQRQLPDATARLLYGARQIVEPVNDQPTEQLALAAIYPGGQVGGYGAARRATPTVTATYAARCSPLASDWRGPAGWARSCCARRRAKSASPSPPPTGISPITTPLHWSTRSRRVSSCATVP